MLELQHTNMMDMQHFSCITSATAGTEGRDKDFCNENTKAWLNKKT